MLKLVIFLLKLIAVVIAAVWIADRAGRVSFEWQDNVIETSLALVIGIIAVVVVLAYNTAKVISAIRNTPRMYRMHTHLRHQRMGQKMLSDALGAFAEDKKGRGIKFLNRAEKLLGKSQVTDLVKHQAEHEGMRGVPAALSDTKMASSKKAAFESELRKRNWDSASELLEQLRIEHVLPRKEWRDTKAALLAERARDALEHNHGAQAFEWAMQADRLRPQWVVAVLLAARALAKQDKAKEAATLIERSWNTCAHEQLGDVYLSLRTGKSDLQKAQAAEKLVKNTINTPASRLLVARALTKAGLWGQARAYARALADEFPNRDHYDLLAHIEDIETQDKAIVAHWKSLAASSPPDEAWICSSCKQPHGEWQASCTSCNSFNTLGWGTPLHKKPVPTKA